MYEMIARAGFGEVKVAQVWCFHRPLRPVRHTICLDNLWAIIPQDGVAPERTIKHPLSLPWVIRLKVWAVSAKTPRTVTKSILNRKKQI